MSVTEFIGACACLVGGFLVVGIIAIWVLDWVGKPLWDKLAAYYDLNVLRWHLIDLERQGKVLRKYKEC